MVSLKALAGIHGMREGSGAARDAFEERQVLATNAFERESHNGFDGVDQFQTGQAQFDEL